MADRTSAEIFGEVFNVLAFELPPETKRFELAKRFWKMSRNYDFSPGQMEADAALIELGLAHLGIDPKYPEDGETCVYEPSPVPLARTDSEGSNG